MSANQTDGLEHIDVAYVARLARLKLTPGETVDFQRRLDAVLDYVRQLKEVDVTGVEPTAHAIPVDNVFRPDVARPGLDHDVVMGNAPAERSDQFFVPKIIE
jgi:aspartyl-tRNA(Asn)/glutamyl-tRNA(Gln) amidotransferase subunit C